MTAMPTTMWMQLSRRLGWDGNPLRRRSDLIAVWLAPATAAVFLCLCPLVAAAAGTWVRADNAAIRQADASSVPVTAVLLRAAPGPAETDRGANTWTVPTLARWTMDGRSHTGYVPAAAGSRAGSGLRVRVSRAGRLQPSPLTPAQVAARVDIAAFLVLAAIAVLLAGLTGLARRALDRRRLAAWESGWLTVGPHWSHRA